MKNLRREEWEFAKAKGRDWFLFRHGVLRLGLLMGFFFTTPEIVGLFTGGTPLRVFPELVAKGMLFALAFGFLWGRSEWNRHRRLYEE